MDLADLAKLETSVDTEVKPRGRRAKVEGESYEPGLKMIFRTINKRDGFENGSEPAAVVEEYVRSYLSSGWKLDSVHPVGTPVEGITLLFVLVR